jgi:hypothetical protein
VYSATAKINSSRMQINRLGTYEDYSLALRSKSS